MGVIPTDVADDGKLKVSDPETSEVSVGVEDISPVVDGVGGSVTGGLARVGVSVLQTQGAVTVIVVMDGVLP